MPCISPNAAFRASNSAGDSRENIVIAPDECFPITLPIVQNRLERLAFNIHDVWIYAFTRVLCCSGIPYQFACTVKYIDDN